jgi:hypothetical protein
MMNMQQRTLKILSSILAAVLCLAPERMSAAAPQNSEPPRQSQNGASTGASNSQTSRPAPQGQQQDQENTGTTIDPTKAPLQPVTTYPEAPAPQPDRSQNESHPGAASTAIAPTGQEQKPSEPVGAAAAEKVPTAGGAAAKPAGAAIAPAKQHQTRSLFLKVGAIAATGIAAGTIFALSRGTSSKPPGAGAPGTTQK